MADGNTGSNNGMLYFIVGALCIVVAVGGFLMFNGGNYFGNQQAKTLDIKVELPKVDKK